jgi:acetyltransferase-like isoleucine patch superfamily enzyme
MKFQEVYIDALVNTTNDVMIAHDVVRIAPGARIVKSKIRGPISMERISLVGPDVTLGKYTGLNQDSFVVRADVGAFCCIGARCAINPFNHPMDWFSVHEFQYHPRAYDWVPEYNEVRHIERTPEMLERISIGNDVWIGNGVNVLGANVGDGAVIAAGSIVTHDVPPYAVVAGAPATIRRYRFDDKTIERFLRSKWWDLELEELKDLPFRDVDKCLDALERRRGL